MFQIRILDRYIFQEVALAWTAVTGILLLVLVTDRLASVLGRVADNHFPHEMIMTLIALTSLENLALLIPIGLLLAIVLALGRMYHDSELVAIFACGVRQSRVYAPVMLFSVLPAGALGWMALVLAPQMGKRAEYLTALAARNAKLENLQPGSFRSLDGNVVFYAAGIDPDGTLKQVFVKRLIGEALEIAVGERGHHYLSRDGQLSTFILEQGHLYRGVPGEKEFRILKFKELTIPISVPDLDVRVERVELKPTVALIRSSRINEKAELQWRLSMPAMALVLAGIAVPLSRLRPRQGRYARVGYAILLYLGYS
jgi:lipopolysaccharide export system permease protein